MQSPVIDVRVLAQAGFEALRRGDTARAREFFGHATATGRADSMIFTGLALACRASGDTDAMVAALDKALELDSHNLRALILKADHYVSAGNPRAATAFYQAAVRRSPPPQQLAPDIAAEVRRAQSVCESHAAQYEADLRARLAEKGFDEALSSRRFAHSLDLLFGRKQVYLQEPRVYYFPELPQIQFYERASLPWLDTLEAATDDIRTELLEVLKDDGAFTPYIDAAPNRPPGDFGGMLGNPSWGAFFLWKNGAPVAENAARCPKTMKALEGAPLALMPGRTPSIMFSLLRPGTRIRPHTGFINTRLICHLPLIVPEKCGLRVGNDVRKVEAGKAWVFDDTIEHEAWNDSDSLRVILLFDIWRPELSEDERALVTAVLHAIDAGDPERQEWDL